jgi:TolB protein
MKKTICLYICFFLAFFITNFPAQATKRIDITQGTLEPMPIAITSLLGQDSESSEVGMQIARVIEADLARSGLFRPIDKSAFIEHITNPSVQPTFQSWRQINASALVTGAIKLEASGSLEIEFRLWDNFAEQQMAGKTYSLPIKLWRRAAHKIADEVYKRLTGEEGYFDTRIAYISETGPGLKRIKRMAIMDQDGENNEFLTSGKNMVLTPRFSPTLKKLLYFSYAEKKPKVFVFDLDSKKSKVLGDFPGMTLAPRFSPDGQTVVMSVSESGNTDIFTMDLSTLGKKKLTNDRAIDVSPSYSHDGKNIVFSSDRGGSSQLYIMDTSGNNVKRISFGSGNYTTPTWSPRGDYIAFTKKSGNNFYIGVMKPDGSGERMLTNGYLVEGPTWSPNGRVIMFSRGEPSYNGKVGPSRLYTIDLTGYNEREVITPTDASDPAWSPLLP